MSDPVEYPADTEARQLRTLHLIKQFCANSIDKIGVEKRTIMHFNNRLTLLEEYWLKFTVDDALLAPYGIDFKDKEYLKKDSFFEGEAAYIGTKTDLQEEVISLAGGVTGAPIGTVGQTTSTQVCSVPPHMNPTTPKIQIPEFDGTQEHWDRWKDLFTAVVINAKLSDAIKLQHSLNAVHGPAKVALGGISVATSKFQVAWDKLLRRYDNPKHKLFNYLEAFVDLPQVSHSSASDLSLLVDRAEEIVERLKDLKCPIDPYDVWFVHLIERKLDEKTRLGWAIHEEEVESFSTYKFKGP